MKKHISILLGLLAVFSSLFISCDENEIDSNICKITVKSEGNGTVSITDYIGTSVNVLIGNRMEVVATPDDGYAFIGWYITGTETPVSINAVFAFTTSESVTLTARFAKLSDIIICSGGNGSVAFKDATGNSIPVLPGAEVTVIATPDTDCDFVGWFVGDSETPISTEKVYTFTVTESIILTGQFSKRPIVTVRSAGNGSVSIKDTYGTYKAFLPGTETTVVATPYKDCDFIGWFVADEGSPISTDTEYTFTVTEDINLTAKFSKRPVVTIRSTDNGNVVFKDYSGTSVAVLPNTEVTVIATPNENCDFVGWFVANEESPISTDAEYNFKVEQNITLTAKFSKRPTVSIHSAGYGSVSFKDYPNNTVVVLPNTEVIVIATPNEDCNFVGWFVDDEENSLSTNAEYSFTVTEDIVITAKFANSIKAVDLGLPSGIKWANMNVGAANPEEFGGYYAWGELEEKEDYSWSTYNGSKGSSNLDLEHDVAHKEMGDRWRIPTYAEQRELCENCTWEWTKVNGVNGYIVTGPNGNSIFLPAAGHRDGVKFIYKGNVGFYFSNRYDTQSYAESLYFDCGRVTYGASIDKYLGLSVRPVYE